MKTKKVVMQVEFTLGRGVIEEDIKDVKEVIYEELAGVGRDLAADAHRGDFDWKIEGLVISWDAERRKVI